MNEVLKTALLDAGADVVGFAKVSEDILNPDIAHLKRAVSIGVSRNLNEDTVHLLALLKKRAASILKQRGYKFLSIPPIYERDKKKFIAKLYPFFTHRIAATSAGLGWIGRNGLLINPEHGPRLSFATVLTDAPLRANRPVERCMCGNCRLCIDHCPAAAITGNDWSREEPFVELVDLERCKSYKKEMRPVKGKPNCGLCITICPHGRKKNNTSSKKGVVKRLKNNL